MDNQAFLTGVGQALLKQADLGNLWERAKAGAKESFRSNVGQPFVQTILDKHYGGLGRYNPNNGEIEKNTSNALRMIAGQASEPTPIGDGWIQQASSAIANNPSGKHVFDLYTGGDKVVGDRMSAASKGVFNVGDNGGVKMDRGKLPGLAMDRISNWVSKNQDTIKGLGLGVGALGLGALAYNSSKPDKPEQTPGHPGLAAPFAGREGNYFTVAE